VSKTDKIEEWQLLKISDFMLKKIPKSFGNIRLIVQTCHLENKKQNF